MIASSTIVQSEIYRSVLLDRLQVLRMHRLIRTSRVLSSQLQHPPPSPTARFLHLQAHSLEQTHSLEVPLVRRVARRTLLPFETPLPTHPMPPKKRAPPDDDYSSDNGFVANDSADERPKAKKTKTSTGAKVSNVPASGKKRRSRTAVVGGGVSEGEFVFWEVRFTNVPGVGNGIQVTGADAMTAVLRQETRRDLAVQGPDVRQHSGVLRERRKDAAGKEGARVFVPRCFSPCPVACFVRLRWAPVADVPTSMDFRASPYPSTNSAPSSNCYHTLSLC